MFFIKLNITYFIPKPGCGWDQIKYVACVDGVCWWHYQNGTINRSSNYQSTFQHNPGFEEVTHLPCEVK